MGLLTKKLAQRAVVAMAAVLTCSGAWAAGAWGDFSFAQSPYPAALNDTVELSWYDGGINGSGFDDATIVVAFDTTVFSFVGAAAGTAFGPTPGLSTPQDTTVDFGGGVQLPGLLFAVTGNGSTVAAAGQDVFHLTLQLTRMATDAERSVYFVNPYGPVGGAYYDFDSVGTAVAAVPEPATVASLLAGLALLAGCSARSRRTRQPNA